MKKYLLGTALVAALAFGNVMASMSVDDQLNEILVKMVGAGSVKQEDVDQKKGLYLDIEKVVKDAQGGIEAGSKLKIAKSGELVDVILEGTDDGIVFPKTAADLKKAFENDSIRKLAYDMSKQSTFAGDKMFKILENLISSSGQKFSVGKNAGQAIDITNVPADAFEAISSDLYLLKKTEIDSLKDKTSKKLDKNFIENAVEDIFTNKNLTRTGALVSNEVGSELSKILSSSFSDPLFALLVSKNVEISRFKADNVYLMNNQELEKDALGVVDTLGNFIKLANNKKFDKLEKLDPKKYTADILLPSKKK